MIDAARDDYHHAAPDRLTLREYFRRDFAPIYLADAAPRTWEAYEGTLRAWERLTADPDLRAIDVRLLAQFRARRAEHCAPTTVNKDLRHLGHLLSKAGPQGHRNRDALGLLPRAPWTRPLRLPRELPREVPLESIGRVYRACEAAVAPRIEGLATADWHRALIVYLYTLAARIGHALDQRWADVDLAARVIYLRATGDKRRRARSKPITDSLAAHLHRLRHVGGERVFPLPCARSWLYAQWRRINAAAGLSGKHRVFPHDLKRAALTQAAGIPGVDPFTVQLFGDHSSLQTTARHYVNPSARLARVAESLPQPADFAAGGGGDPQQRRLFE